jgi:transposase
VLAGEAFFRDFHNRREVASYAGLAPSPWQSGGVDQEQGISKAGNARVRKTMGRSPHASPHFASMMERVGVLRRFELDLFDGRVVTSG